MPQVRFTPNLRRHTDCTDERCAGTTVGEVLADYFRRHPAARGYVLDDQGGVRQHVVVFVNGRQVRDRVALSDPVAGDAEIFVFQALSGGVDALHGAAAGRRR